MRSLESIIIDGGEETYPLVRCAALYLSVLEWSGEDKLGGEAAQSYKVLISRASNLATEIRMPSLGENAEESVFRDVRIIGDDYLERYQRNYAKDGQAFGVDSMWSSDSEICKQLLGQ